ncbi:lipopolysaccharide biosynthesis protein [Demequina maris]|uniref:lipopolysaccharide biosynthesis protein n=1 Tax=Demequina maris TaxID=1638982 RepID=UPI00155B2B33|nr:polysaccharide biosynthesis C-terminal domain-containing protein [Demequina maris]
MNLVPYAAVVSAPLGLLTGVLQARLLGPEGRGELAAAATPAALIAMLLCFGTPDFFARAAAMGSDTRQLSRDAVSIAAAVAAAAIIPYVLFAASWSDGSGTVRTLLLVYAVLLPVQIYGYQLGAIAAGVSRWKAVTIVRLAPGVIAAILLGGMLAVDVGWGRDPLLVGLALILPATFAPLALLRVPKMWPRRRSSRAARREAWRFGLRGWPAGAVALLNQRVDLLIVLAIADSATAGYYAVSVSLAAIVTAFVNAVILPIRNEVARGHNEVVWPASSTLALLTAAIATIAVPVLPWFVPFAFGSEYAAAIPLMIAIVVAQIPQAVVILLTQTLVSAGRPLSPVWGETAALLVTVAAIPLLFKQFGVLGAVGGSALGTIVSLAVLVVLVRRHVDQDLVPRRIRPSVTSLMIMLGKKVDVG